DGRHALGFPYSIVDHVAVPSDIEAEADPAEIGNRFSAALPASG
ncbi:uncharacterized protein METZ01_LOCUS325659, partial [marine metagenome]